MSKYTKKSVKHDGYNLKDPCKTIIKRKTEAIQLTTLLKAAWLLPSILKIEEALTLFPMAVVQKCKKFVTQSQVRIAKALARKTWGYAKVPYRVISHQKGDRMQVDACRSTNQTNVYL